jgi:hypothetical protein
MQNDVMETFKVPWCFRLFLFITCFLASMSRCWTDITIERMLKSKTHTSFSITIKTISKHATVKNKRATQLPNSNARLVRPQGPWGVYSNRESSIFCAPGERQQENASSIPSVVLTPKKTTHGYANTRERNTVMKVARRRGVWLQPIVLDS